MPSFLYGDSPLLDRPPSQDIPPMTKQTRLTNCLLVYLCVAVFSPASAADPTAKVIELFDGKTLEGWTDVAGSPVSSKDENGWKVEGGELVRKGRGGTIYAEGEYENFVLEFEWKIAKGGNSGVKYRVKYYEKGLWGRSGWLGFEYQIYGDRNPEASKGRKGGIGSAGALYALYAPNEKKKLAEHNTYNIAKIVVCGTHIEHWLNGEKIVDADTSTDEFAERVKASKFNQVPDFGQNRKGRIQIQDHGSNVAYRNIRLTVLPPGDGEASNE